MGPEGEVAGHVTAVVQLASSFFWTPLGPQLMK